MPRCSRYRRNTASFHCSDISRVGIAQQGNANRRGAFAFAYSARMRLLNLYFQSTRLTEFNQLVFPVRVSAQIIAVMVPVAEYDPFDLFTIEFELMDAGTVGVAMDQ